MEEDKKETGHTDLTDDLSYTNDVGNLPLGFPETMSIISIRETWG